MVSIKILELRAQSVIEPCSICKGGVPYDTALSNKTIDLPVGTSSLSLTCATLDASLPFLVPNSTHDDCFRIQSLGSLCGCPIRDDACTLCTDGSPITSPNNTLPFLEDQFGFIPTCELLEAFLLSQNVTNNTLCGTSQALVADYCGCHGATISKGCSFCPDGQIVPLPDKELNNLGLPFNTCGQLESALSLVIQDGQDMCNTFQKFSSYCGCTVAENACEMCPHGEISFPDKILTSLIGNAGIAAFDPTCKIFEALTRSMRDNSEDCLFAHLIGGYCGCPPVDNFCTLCEDKPVPEDYLDVVLDPEIMKKVTGMDVSFFTCRDGESFLSQVNKNDGAICYTAQYRGDLCGCYEGGFGYLGTKEHPERRPAYPWVMRTSALLSMISVALIAQDVLRDKKKRQNVYCRLMLGMSIFDFFSGFAWLTNTAAIPYSIAEPIYGASGNDATCKAQCFFFQLALGSILYNVSLTTYYYMVIVLSKREQWLKKQQWWLHGMPIVTGLTLSFAAIPFASNDYFGCHVPISPREFDWTSYGLYVFPVGFVLFYCTGLILYICWSVRRQNSAANKWSFPLRGNTSRDPMTAKNGTLAPNHNQSATNNHKKAKKTKAGAFNKLQSQVMWQSVFYLGAFWCTWPLFVWAYVALDTVTALPEPWEYIYSIISITFAPLQGFLNGIIYFRSKLSRILCKQKPKSNRRETSNVKTSFLSSIKLSSLWNKVFPLSWSILKRGINQDNDLKDEKLNTSIMPVEQDILCNSSQNNDGTIEVDKSSNFQTMKRLESSKRLDESIVMGLQALDFAEIQTAGQDEEEHDVVEDFTEIDDTDPSILLAAMAVLDDSESDVDIKVFKLSSIDESKELFD